MTQISLLRYSIILVNKKTHTPAQHIIILSENVLFREILARSLEKQGQATILSPTPAYATQLIQKNQPEKLIIDETLPPTLLGEILQTALQLPSCKLVFLNPYQNDTVILDPKRKFMRKADDLMYILNDEFEQTANTLATPETPEFGDVAQAREAMFALLAAFINQRPDSEFVNKLRTAGIHQFLSILIDKEGQSQIHDGLQELGAYLEETLKKDENSLVEELAVDWTRLFRGLRPGYGPKPPYAYLHKKTKLSELDFLQKISGIYTSFGASIEPTQSNRPDYLGLQLAFLSFLYQQASEAYQIGNKDKAVQFELAATDFFENEFADWALTFCQEAKSHAKTAFYHGYLTILQGQIRDLAEC